MRARLLNGVSGSTFRFMCDHKMAEKMDAVIEGAGGEILEKDVRSYGVVMLVRKEM